MEQRVIMLRGPRAMGPLLESALLNARVRLQVSLV